MPNDTKSPNGSLTVLKSWWPIIIFILALAVTWGTFTAQMGVLSAEQMTIRNGNSARDITLTQIQVQLAAVQQDVLWIRERLSKETGR